MSAQAMNAGASRGPVSAWMVLAACLAVAMTSCGGRPEATPPRCPEIPGPAELPPRMAALAKPMLDFYARSEARFLREGRPLAPGEQAMARALGVRYPERVRVAVTPTLPWPTEPALQREAARLGLDTLPEAGRAMGYAILLKPHAAGDLRVLAHELVHVAQMERLGREGFLRRYFAELYRVGYSCSALEREARAASAPYGD